MSEVLSILMSVKNESEYITEALDSIEKTDISKDISVEVVIVDDGSNDNTCEIIRSRNQQNIKLIESGGVGKANAYSLAYKHSIGDYFILFAGDDTLISDMMIERVSPLIGKKEVPSVTFAKMLSFSNNKKYDNILLPKNPNHGMRSGSGICFNKAFAKLVFPIPSVLPNEDSWIMHFPEYFDVSVFEVPKVCMRYRIHENNSYKRGVDFSSVKYQQWIRARSSLIFYTSYFNKLDKECEKKLLLKIVLDIFKYLGNSVNLLFLGSVPLKDRLKALFNSSSVMYHIREFAYSFFSGR